MIWPRYSCSTAAAVYAGHVHAAEAPLHLDRHGVLLDVVAQQQLGVVDQELLHQLVGNGEGAGHRRTGRRHGVEQVLDVSPLEHRVLPAEQRVHLLGDAGGFHGVVDAALRHQPRHGDVGDEVLLAALERAGIPQARRIARRRAVELRAVLAQRRELVLGLLGLELGVLEARHQGLLGPALAVGRPALDVGAVGDLLHVLLDGAHPGVGVELGRLVGLGGEHAGLIMRALVVS